MMSAGTTAGPTQLGPRAQAVADRIDRGVLWVAKHWLLAMICLGAIATGLSIAAPLLRASDWAFAADWIYFSYRLMCHQRPDRTFHLYGEQMAFCQRDLAIFAAAIAVASLFGVKRRAGPPAGLRFRWVVLLALPMVVDGGTQLIGLRESTWALRLITGALFSIGAGWYALPILNSGFMTIRNDVEARIRSAASPGVREAPTR